MNITQLDEWQGLTADMVREWLTAQKATFRDGRWTHPNGKYRYTDREYGGLLWPPTLSQMAVHFDKANEQALLREINPRMRNGIPSQAALRAHRGLWLRSIGTETIATVLSRLIDEFPSPRDNESYFWPCDANGNKVRWPTDAEGKML